MSLNYQELVTKSKAELLEQRNKLSEELFKLRFKRAGDSLKQTHLMKITKKDIARVNTALSKISDGDK